MPATKLGSKDLQFHPIHDESQIPEFDVFIAGSGPIGATYARCLVDAGYSVLMTEIGDQDTRLPATHKKNEIEYQKDIDRFGALSIVSIPPSQTIVPQLGPAVWTAKDPEQMWIMNGRNPFQGEHNNLGAEAVTRGVGGMSTHWTCATPEFLKDIERPLIFPDSPEDDAEWKLLYDSARSLIGTSETEFDHSIRHNVVLEALQKAYPDRGVKNLPLACHRLFEQSPYIHWHSAADVYGDMFTNREKENKQGVKRGYFKILANTRCTRFVLDTSAPDGHKIGLVEVQDLLGARLVSESSSPEIDFYIRAKVSRIITRAVATPQILANSDFGAISDEDKTPGADFIIPHLATHITEQPMAFCQVVMLQHLVDGIDTPDRPNWWKDAVAAHKERFGKVDALPIPFQDLEPQVTIPASEDRPWHTQIHRDAFNYGEVGPSVDSRLVVDLRFFGMEEGVSQNRMVFHKSVRDAYGMPQPTFEYTPTTKSADDTQRMMNDMTDVANKLGVYLPGKHILPGLALHLGGTTRLGLGKDIDTTVANFNSQVWNFSNLFVGGNGTIPTPFGANPTLTSMCLALRSAYKIAESLEKGFSPAVAESVISKTPASWLSWTTDESDPNFPTHETESQKSL
ncbi:putative pyranose oxidase [Mycena epipterygia]|nr:putative pyranose oxidase [Mycena epipterygia]